MATVNSMLIPDVEISDFATEDYFYRARVLDHDGNVLWSSPVWLRCAGEALGDAHDAVDSLAYERRHQLQLL